MVNLQKKMTTLDTNLIFQCCKVEFPKIFSLQIRQWFRLLPGPSQPLRPDNY